jgi:Mg-chelatase subunit ChlD
MVVRGDLLRLRPGDREALAEALAASYAIAGEAGMSASATTMIVVLVTFTWGPLVRDS